MVRHKYGVAAASERVYNGILYHSKREKTYATLLDTMKTARSLKDRVVSWDRQVRLPMIVASMKICTYVCDFRVEYADGRIEYQEVKGADTAVGNLKMRLFKALYPDLTIRVIR